MLPITVTLEGAEDLATAWVNVRAAVRAGMRRGVALGVKEGAEEARKLHRFKNQTTNLEKSIVGKVTGSSDTEHKGEIVATMPYASWVEEGRGIVRVKRAQWLVFEIDGVTFFRKWVRPALPRPFMSIAYLKCERVIIREIEIGIAYAKSILERP